MGRNAHLRRTLEGMRRRRIIAAWRSSRERQVVPVGGDVMDIKDSAARSRNMAAIRSRDTGPEMRLRSAVWQGGMRFFTTPGWQRLTGERLIGSPDLIFPAARVVLFVDGCFWHGCPNHYRVPDSRTKFWRDKLDKNRQRDTAVNCELTTCGWRVRRLWEHQLTVKRLPEAVRQVAATLQQARASNSGSYGQK
jgi:DNA mismatch endonuclease (patch repair protein)